MDAQREKIYVAVGNDWQDGFKTLGWALKNWSSDSISIVILQFDSNISKDYVYTPFGKLPARSVNDEKLEILRKCEQQEIKNKLSEYIAFCEKVPAEILEVEKFDEPIQKRITDLIFGLEINKLVMGFSSMKGSWKSKGVISGLFYIHQHKPDFCELFIICNGKQVFLRGRNDEKIMEDDKGVMVARMRDRVTFRDWLEKIFTEKLGDTPDGNSRGSSNRSLNMESPVSQNQWELHLQEIENYSQELFSCNLEIDSCGQENDVLQISPIEPEQKNSNTDAAEKIEVLKIKLKEAHETIQLKRKEAKDSMERQAKAEWAICLCNSRIEELESKIKDEINIREELKKKLESGKEHNYEIRSDVEEKRRRVRSVAELQAELSNKLQISLMARLQGEARLENALKARSEMVKEIEELRKQRDVLNRRIEFCKEKDAIGMAARMSETRGCSFREYTEEELRLATDQFSERLRFKSGGDWTNVYKGRFNHSSVAIKMLTNFHALSQEQFLAKVKLLGDVRQPHLVAMLGFCSEPKCIIYEYMHNGSLQDILFSRRRNRALRWHDRIRILTEVCWGLGFLCSNQSRPIIHCHLAPSKILLDRNLVSKITGFGLYDCEHDCSGGSEIRALGILMAQLLTGRNWAGLVEETMIVDTEALARVLDEKAGQWPLDLAKELAGLAMRCMSSESEPDTELNIGMVIEEVNKIRRKADDLVAQGGRRGMIGEGVDKEDSTDVPNLFLCPILQEVMKNPHVAADGFSYELGAIEQWLHSGHETSPMTNLRLKHRFLSPNHSLRSLIEDWQSKRMHNP
ncbi:hypothetical protein L6164_027336 [Bauhinia variegata]|uniref:Uncharacterized protein n=1 Tax=Bauhinia variegata TaxID=167791 RepID=A0ACB9LSN5_BAUVA|nr:hypothetical protein L6164_027336 [Bauhinia variegata]